MAPEPTQAEIASREGIYRCFASPTRLPEACHGHAEQGALVARDELTIGVVITAQDSIN